MFLIEDLEIFSVTGKLGEIMNSIKTIVGKKVGTLRTQE